MRNRNVEIITSSLNIRDVMEHYGVVFNNRGFAICPFHSEKTASLSTKNNHYKCFGCGAYGGIIDFVMNYFHLNFPQAVTRIGVDFGLHLEGRRVSYRERAQAAENRRIDEAEKKFRQDIRNNYLWLCDVHSALYGAYLRTGSERIKSYVDELADILDDFSGEEARNWEMRLFPEIRKSTPRKIL